MRQGELCGCGFHNACSARQMPYPFAKRGGERQPSNGRRFDLDTSLIVTPPYPEHTSGANKTNAAATHSLSLFFGTNDMSFTITTTNPGPTVDDTRGRPHPFPRLTLLLNKASPFAPTSLRF